MALVPHTSPMARVPQAPKLSRPTAAAVAAAAQLRVQVEVAVAAALRVLHALLQPKMLPAAALLMEGLGQVALLQALIQLHLLLLVVAAVAEEAAVAGAVALLLLLRMLRAEPQVQPAATLPLPLLLP
jgi:hypothetical protein